ncbi:MAG: biopolymer transporter ExbD, partial [Zoogloea sp.]|nr:biopolymer transporter ExbD [Zoogloea sp.]
MMAFSVTPGGNRQPVAEINMVPLIDVMLVLLIVFIVAAPLITHSVRVDLPRAASHPTPAQPQAIALALRADGSVFWNQEQVTEADLPARMQAAASRDPATELHIAADAHT